MNQNSSGYFDAKAANYKNDSLRWPWSFLRGKERRAVLQLIGNINGTHVLDFGCGAGYYTELMLCLGADHVTAVDRSPAMVAQLSQEHVTGIVADAGSFDTEEKFERIICAGMLEFVPKPEEILKNAHEPAADNAVMVILVPLHNIFGYLYRLFHLINGNKIHLFQPHQFQTMASTLEWSCEQFVKCMASQGL